MTPRPPGGRTRGHLILMVDKQNLSADRHFSYIRPAQTQISGGANPPAFGTVTSDRLAVLSKVRRLLESGCFF